MYVVGEHLSCSFLNAVCQDFCPVPVVAKTCQNVAFMTSQQLGSWLCMVGANSVNHLRMDGHNTAGTKTEKKFVWLN